MSFGQNGDQPGAGHDIATPTKEQVEFADGFLEVLNKIHDERGKIIHPAIASLVHIPSVGSAIQTAGSGILPKSSAVTGSQLSPAAVPALVLTPNVPERLHQTPTVHIKTLPAPSAPAVVPASAINAFAGQVPAEVLSASKVNDLSSLKSLHNQQATTSSCGATIHQHENVSSSSRYDVPLCQQKADNPPAPQLIINRVNKSTPLVIPNAISGVQTNSPPAQPTILTSENQRNVNDVTVCQLPGQRRNADECLLSFSASNDGKHTAELASQTHQQPEAKICSAPVPIFVLEEEEQQQRAESKTYQQVPEQRQQVSPSKRRLPSSLKVVTDEDEQKKLRNREAASRCREKKLKLIEKMKVDTDQTNQENVKLKEQVVHFQQIMARVYHFLQQHQNSGKCMYKN